MEKFNVKNGLSVGTDKRNIIDSLGGLSATSVTVNDQYTLPSVDGSLNQAIVTDGGGNLSFTDIVLSSDISGVSANWQNTYTAVSENSASWSPQNLSFNESAASLTIANGNTVSLSALSSVGMGITYNRWAFTGNGTLSSFSISGANTSISEAFIVTIDAVIQDPISYTVNAVTDTITFSGVPELSSAIVIIEQYSTAVRSNIAHYGQLGTTTNSTVTGLTPGEYKSTGIIGTLDSQAYGFERGTDGLSLKNISGQTLLCRMYASADVQAGNNKILGLMLALDGVLISQTECRAPTGVAATFAKLVTSWLIEIPNNKEVALYLANHTDAGNLTVQRCKIIAATVGRQGEQGPPGPQGGIGPVGSVITFAGSSAPTGWLLCFGQAVSRSTYADLFAVIGTTYGHDDADTFKLPDLRGRVAAGKDDMGGTATNPRRLSNSGTGNPGIDGLSLGAVGGVDRHLLTSNQSGLPAHNHAYTRRANGSTTASGTASRPITTSQTFNTSTNTAADAAEAHPNAQPTIVLNYIIKT